MNSHLGDIQPRQDSKNSSVLQAITGSSENEHHTNAEIDDGINANILWNFCLQVLQLDMLILNKLYQFVMTSLSFTCYEFLEIIVRGRMPG